MNENNAQQAAQQPAQTGNVPPGQAAPSRGRIRTFFSKFNPKNWKPGPKGGRLRYGDFARIKEEFKVKRDQAFTSAGDKNYNEKELVSALKDAIVHEATPLDRWTVSDVETRQVILSRDFIRVVDEQVCTAPFEKTDDPTLTDDAIEAVRKNLVEKLSAGMRGESIGDLSAQEIDIIITTMLIPDWTPTTDYDPHQADELGQVLWSETILPNPRESFFKLLDSLAENKPKGERGIYKSVVLKILANSQTVAGDEFDLKISGSADVLVPPQHADEYVDGRFTSTFTEAYETFRTEAEKILKGDPERMYSGAVGCGLDDNQVSNIMNDAKRVFIGCFRESELEEIKRDSFTVKMSKSMEPFYKNEALIKLLDEIKELLEQKPDGKILAAVKTGKHANLPKFAVRQATAYLKETRRISSEVENAAIPQELKSELKEMVDDAKDPSVALVKVFLAEDGFTQHPDRSALDTYLRVLEEHKNKAFPLRSAAEATLENVEVDELMLGLDYKKQSKIVHPLQMEQHGKIMQKVLSTRIGFFVFGRKFTAKEFFLAPVGFFLKVTGLLKTWELLRESSIVKTFRYNWREMKEERQRGNKGFLHALKTIKKGPWLDKPTPVARQERYIRLRNTKGKRALLRILAYATVVLATIFIQPVRNLVKVTARLVYRPAAWVAKKTVGKVELPYPKAWKVWRLDSWNIAVLNPDGWWWLGRWADKEYGHKGIKNPFEAPGTRDFWPKLPSRSTKYFESQYGVATPSYQKWLKKHVSVLRALQEWSTGMELAACKHMKRRTKRWAGVTDKKKGKQPEKQEKVSFVPTVNKEGKVAFIIQRGEAAETKGKGKKKSDKAKAKKPAPKPEIRKLKKNEKIIFQEGNTLVKEVTISGVKRIRRKGKRRKSILKRVQRKLFVLEEEGKESIIGEVVRVGRGVKRVPRKKSPFPHLNIVPEGGTPVAALCTAPIEHGYMLNKKYSEEFVRELMFREKNGDRVSYDYMQRNAAEWHSKGFLFSSAEMKIMKKGITTSDNIIFLMANRQAEGAIKEYLTKGEAPQYLIKAKADEFVTAWRKEVAKRLLEENEAMKKDNVKFHPSLDVSEYDDKTIKGTFEDLKKKYSSFFKGCPQEFKIRTAFKEINASLRRIGGINFTASRLSNTVLKCLIANKDLRPGKQSKDVEVRGRLTKFMNLVRETKLMVNPKKVNELVFLLLEAEPDKIDIGLMRKQGILVIRVAKKVRKKRRTPPTTRRRGRRRGSR